ncbi:MAG: hypothetical protein R3F35_13540 [Myxococcota bacterium]
MESTNRKLWQCGSIVALAALGLLVAGSASAGGRGDYWDPRASIPARIIDTQLGVIGLAATIAGDYRTAAVVDHISGRFPAPAPIAVVAPAPVVQHVYYPPAPPVVQHVYHYAPPPTVIHHVHRAGCGHGGDWDHRRGPGKSRGRGHGGWHR